MNAVEMKRSTPSKLSANVPDELAAVWMKLLDAKWSALAVVSASKNATADGLISAFDAMVASTTGQLSRILDLRGAKLDAIAAVVEEVRRARDEGDRLLVVLDDPRKSPLSQAALRMADQAAILIRKGETTTGDVETVAGYCAEGRIIGSVLVS